MLRRAAEPTPDDLHLVADLTKHPAWQALERGIRAAIERDSRLLAKRLLTEDFEIDVAQIERDRAYWRGQLDLAKTPTRAFRRVNRQQKED